MLLCSPIPTPCQVMTGRKSKKLLMLKKFRRKNKLNKICKNSILMKIQLLLQDLWRLRSWRTKWRNKLLKTLVMSLKMARKDRRLKRTLKKLQGPRKLKKYYPKLKLWPRFQLQIRQENSQLKMVVLTRMQLHRILILCWHIRPAWQTPLKSLTIKQIFSFLTSH